MFLKTLSKNYVFSALARSHNNKYEVPIYLQITKEFKKSYFCNTTYNIVTCSFLV